MRIVFVANTTETLGIEYLSAYLKRAGHSVHLVFDPLLFRDFFTTSPVFSRWFDMRDAVIEQTVNLNPDAVLFSVLSGSYRWSLRMAGELKKRTKAIIIFGGIHPTSVPDIVVKEPAVDFVGVGECEEALVELLGYISAGKDPARVRNFWMKKGGSVIANPLRPLVEDLDELLLPDKDIFYNAYHALVDQNYIIATSRGCAYQCSFCYNSYVKALYPEGRFYRRRSIDSVISELKLAMKRFAIKSVYFVDDILTQDRHALGEFIKRYKDEIRLPFRCEVAPKTVDEEVAFLLSEAGCVTVNMGVQTLSHDLRKKVLNRHDSNDDILRAITVLRKKRIAIHANIIMGIPGQDEQEWLAIARFFNRHKVEAVLVFWLIYYPRIAIIKKALEYGILRDKDVQRLENEPLEVNTFSESKNFADRTKVKFANLISLSVILPRGIFDFVVRHKIFYAIPDVAVRILNVCTMGLIPAFKSMVSGRVTGGRALKTASLYFILHYTKEFLYVKSCNQPCSQRGGVL